MEYKLRLDRKLHPLLFKIKKKDLDKVINDIFSLGYSKYFPDTNKITNNDTLEDKLFTLENTLEKLIGLSSTSSKKGELAENMLENLISLKYGDIKYTDMSQVNHSGDAWLNIDGVDNIIMLESKNYTTKVNKDEITKMRNDMITNNIKWGIFVSWNSDIQGFREFDIDTFNHQGNVYTIVMISKLSNDVDRLDMGIQVIRKLIKNYSKLETFPWVTSKISSELDKLNGVINLNYQLRNWFEDMEYNIKSSLSKYYTNMREYQFKIDKYIKEITDNINGTLEDSIETHNINFNYQEYLQMYSNNKKLFTLLAQILDMFKQKNIRIQDEDLLIINDKIGTIKIQKKKIVLFWKNFNSSTEFLVDNDNELSFNIFNLF